MKYKNIYNVLSKFIHVLTPLIILICSIYESIIYKKGSDSGGFGSLAIALNIMISIGWLFIILFVVYLSNMICKKEIYKRIVKLIISIINVFIWCTNSSILLNNSIIVIFNILLIIITGILLIFYGTKESNNNV